MDKFLSEEPLVPRTDQEKKAIMNRLKRVEGQIRGIQKMVEEDRYCIDVLIQISAIDAALKRVGLSIGERHMMHCVNESIEELIVVMKLFTKEGRKKYEANNDWHHWNDIFLSNLKSPK